MTHTMNKSRYYFFIRMTFFTAALFMVAFLFQGCGQNLKKGDFKTEYQGILLINGIGYYGKIEKMGTRYIEIIDVYYISSQQNPETKEVKSILVKRGKELHGPDRMYVNTDQVLMIEPVSPDSKLAQLIKDIKSKGAEEKK